MRHEKKESQHQKSGWIDLLVQKQGQSVSRWCVEEMSQQTKPNDQNSQKGSLNGCYSQSLHLQKKLQAHKQRIQKTNVAKGRICLQNVLLEELCLYAVEAGAATALWEWKGRRVEARKKPALIRKESRSFVKMMKCQ